MDMGKIFALLCALLLAVCLVLAVTTLTVLRNAVAENKAMQEEAAILMNVLSGSVDKLEDSIEVSIQKPQEPTDTTDQKDIYIVKSINGRICVCNEEGTVIYCTDLSLALLPDSDRELLEKGIRVEGLEGLVQLMNDYRS